ncbi:MAG: hypothetical protein LBG17_02790 [Bacteroidales bacterium]|nr:hypothetical protein [Bacteroidales bacterium]
MLQLLVLLQGWVFVPSTDSVPTFPVGGVIILGVALFAILVFGVAAVADFITFLRKKSKQNTPTV